MTRAILVAGAAAWMVAGMAGLTAALIGIEAVEAMLPPLAIGPEALARTVAALAVAALVVALVHVAVLAGLVRGRSWGASAGVLLCGVSVAGFVALAAAGLTAGMAGSMAAPAAVAVGIGSLLMAAAYAAAGSALVRRLRSRPPV